MRSLEEAITLIKSFSPSLAKADADFLHPWRGDSYWVFIPFDPKYYFDEILGRTLFVVFDNQDNVVEFPSHKGAIFLMENNISYYDDNFRSNQEILPPSGYQDPDAGLLTF